MLPKTVDDVIEALGEIIQNSLNVGDRLGYFAALYRRVTMAVRDGIKSGQFEDGARMEKLDVTFANRYITAYQQYQAGEIPSRSWLLAFEAGKNENLCILQHLLLGMNAHINLDLGIAAGRTAGKVEALKPDFEKINQILASLVPPVEQGLSSISPHFTEMVHFDETAEDHLLSYSMEKARDEAWNFCSSLAGLPLPEQIPKIQTRDSEASLLGTGLLHIGPVGSWLKNRESSDIRANILAIS